MTGRALVLGGGGVTGVAWELGLLTGLADAGVSLTDADLVIGTSAGSVVGAQVAAGLDLAERYARQLIDPTGEIAARLTRATMLRLGWAAVRTRDGQAFRARVGRMALAARTIPEAERRDVIETRLPVKEWPERRLLLTAVDAQTGELVVFDRDGEVTLVDAVAASCAVPGVWPPVSIDGRRFIDGGIRSTTNADLAAGCERVVIIAPIPAGFGPIAGAEAEAAELRRTARVVVIAPDPAAKHAIGRNVLDPARRPGAARAGRAQAAAVADAVRNVWLS
ncbi:MAG TPA: patatin-like phospholipase family protein [Micromonosporaceae bacterium]|nr:patatin-like phospholipase family protein [Micromonosporaceae bacterium]